MATQREIEIANMKRMERIERKIDVLRGLVEDLLDIKSDADKKVEVAEVTVEDKKGKKSAK